MLNELFSERWALLLEASEEVQRSDASPREKLAGVANFIIESYRHEPELMKVIIVEVTRAANSFGRTHLPEIRKAYDLVAEIVSDAQSSGEFRDDVDPSFSAMVFYGAIEQLLTGWIFDLIPGTDEDYERAKQLVIETICGGLEPRPVGGRGRRLAICGRDLRGLSARTAPCTALAKLANLLLGIVLLPLWLFGQLVGGRVRDFLTSLERRGQRPLPVPPERERTMEALMRRPAGDPGAPPSLQPGRAAQGDGRHLELRHRPAPRGRRARLPLPGPVQGPHRRGRRRRADRGLDRAAGGGSAGPDRRPRPLHLEPLRLRPPDRGPRLLRVGLQRRRPRPAQLRHDGADQPGSLDRRAGRRGSTSSPWRAT